MCKTTPTSNKNAPVHAKRAAGGTIQLMHSQMQLQQQQQQQLLQQSQQQLPGEVIVVQPPVLERNQEQKQSLPPKEELSLLSDEEGSDDEKDEARIVKPACINCRRSKVRCEGGIPCRRCTRLSIDNSCQRCEPKKRGRKRKIRPATEETQLLESLFEQARQSKAVDVSTLLPARTPESLEKDEIERFAALTAQFRQWREQLTNDPNVEQADLMRFLWFCSYLSNVINGYIGQFVNPAQAQKLVSVWLCSNLADDVNRFVTSLGPDLISFPTIDDTEDLQSAVERQVFKNLPTGVVTMSLHPRPFFPGNKPWLNSKMCQILGYSKEEARVLMSHRTFFLRMIQPSSFASLSSSFWQAVATRKTAFTLKCKWINKSGQIVDTVGTFSIKYMHGLPVSLSMFHQVPPTSDSRVQESEPVTSAASFKFNQELLNPAPKVQTQSPNLSLGFSPMPVSQIQMPIAISTPAAPVAAVQSITTPSATYPNYFDMSAVPNNAPMNNTTYAPVSEVLIKPSLAFSKDDAWGLSPLSMGPVAMLDLVLNPNPEF